MRYGDGRWPGLTVHRLMPGHAKPLAAPALLERHGLSAAEASYWLCHPEGRGDDPAVAAFRAFVFAEAGIVSDGTRL